MTEHQPGPPGDTRDWTITIVLIVAAAAALRFSNLGGGLPSSLGVDEPQIVVRSLTMVRTGDFHPHFFDYPGLYLYLQAAVIVARFLAGASAGAWSSLTQVTDYDFYLWGRALTAAFGTATVYVVYLAGRRWGVKQGLLAAAVLAVLPVHVRESHYVLTDVPATFFVALTLLLSLRAEEQRTVRAFAWAGAAAGLAAGTKYTAWVSVILPLVAAGFVWMPLQARVQKVLAVLAGFGAAFLIVAPYTLLDLPGFLNGFGTLAAAVPKRLPSADPGWQIYLKHLRLALGWPAFVLAGGGLVLFAAGVMRGPVRARFAMVLLFMLVFWSMIIDRTLIFARYLMPMLPFVCLLVGAAIAALLERLGQARMPRAGRAPVAAALICAGLFQPAMSSMAFVREMGRLRTDSLALEWVERHAKPGSRIVHEMASLHFPPGRYEVQYMRSVSEQSLDFYLENDVDYVVAMSAVYGKSFADPQRFQEEYLAYRNLFDRLRPEIVIQPSTEHPGPEIRIFSVPR